MRVAAFIAALVLSFAAHAQIALPLSGGTSGGGGGGGCSNNCTFTGTTTTSGINDSGGINTPSIGLGTPGTGTFTTVTGSIAGDFGSVVVGSPTGGNEGAGTINATGIYLNGVLLSPSGTGVLMLVKTTPPSVAPGAGLMNLYAVAGTLSGTCKIIALAGTSTTPTTIADNIGGGC